MSLSIPQRVISEKLIFVNYVVVRDEKDAQHWYYIAVRAHQMEAFKKSLNSPNFDPEEHGVVLESGMGDPDETTRKRMELQYGCNHKESVPLPLESQASAGN